MVPFQTAFHEGLQIGELFTYVVCAIEDSLEVIQHYKAALLSQNAVEQEF